MGDSDSSSLAQVKDKKRRSSRDRDRNRGRDRDRDRDRGRRGSDKQLVEKSLTIRRKEGERWGIGLRGCKIAEVDQGSPAERAGVKVGWKCAELGGREVANGADIAAALSGATDACQCVFLVEGERRRRSRTRTRRRSRTRERGRRSRSRGRGVREPPPPRLTRSEERDIDENIGKFCEEQNLDEIARSALRRCVGQPRGVEVLELMLRMNFANDRAPSKLVFQCLRDAEKSVRVDPPIRNLVRDWCEQNKVGARVEAVLTTLPPRLIEMVMEKGPVADRVVNKCGHVMHLIKVARQEYEYEQMMGEPVKPGRID